MEGEQYELDLEFQTPSELNHVLKILLQSVNQFRLDSKGRIRKQNSYPIPNPFALPESWDIPVLAIKSDIPIRNFLRCINYSLGKQTHRADFFVRRKNKILEERLESFNFHNSQDRILLNRVFVEEYLVASLS